MKHNSFNVIFTVFENSYKQNWMRNKNSRFVSGALHTTYIKQRAYGSKKKKKNPPLYFSE